MFRCTTCHAPLRDDNLSGAMPCAQCGSIVESVDGIPILVRDRRLVEQTIADAKEKGLKAWYTQPQIGQWTGPYRHHMAKRRKWLEAGLTEKFGTGAGAPLTGLDLGCGDGTNLHWLRDHFAHLCGSDYNILRLLRAKSRGFDVELFLADVCDYPAQDNVFDVVFFNHVLEHVPDDATALREAHRILKPGGLLILGVPNEGAAFWQLAYRLQPGVRAASDHVHFYTADTLAEKCEAAGFRVGEVHPIGWGVPHWTLDAAVRRFKWIDDGLEMLGRRFMPGQATSLYALLYK